MLKLGRKEKNIAFQNKLPKSYRLPRTFSHCYM